MGGYCERGSQVSILQSKLALSLPFCVRLDLSFVNIDDIIKAIMNVDIAPLTEQTLPTMQAGSRKTNIFLW